MTSEGNYYFICNIEGDFLICAGMSQLIKRTKHSAKTTMIMPEHFRVKNKMEHYYQYFDEVFILPYINYKKNLFKGIAECNSFIKELNKIQIPKGSNIFMFDIYELSELIIYGSLTKKRNKDKLKINCISAFEIHYPDKDNIPLVWLNTLFLSFYSLLYTKKVFLDFKNNKISYPIDRFFKAYWDNMVCIKDSLPNTLEFEQIHKNLPYPLSFIEIDSETDFIENMHIISEDCFIILVGSSIPRIFSITPEHYWGQINNLIEYLNSRYKYKIYVKNHPGFPGDSEKWIKNKNVSFIDRSIFAEELYLMYRKNIMGVFGYGSTGLLTASWLQIKAINIDQYLGIQGQALQTFKMFMNLSKDVKNIESLEDLENVFFHESSFVNTRLEYEKWENVISML